MKFQSIENLFKCLLITLPLVFVGCNKDDKPTPKEFSPFGIFGETQNVPTLKFINDQGQPLVGAQVLIGLAEGAFPGNFGKTDENGDFVVPADWTSADMMTVDAPAPTTVTTDQLDICAC